MTDESLSYTGGRPLFDTGAADADKAQALFPNQGLHAPARLFAFAHSRAIQYLEQAPVLVYGVAYSGRGVHRMNQLYTAHKLVPLCARGAPLKELMRAYDMALPLRKLTGFALFPKAASLIKRLSAVDPAVLGRIIPDRPGAQRIWLTALMEWRERMERRGADRDLLFDWAATNLAASKIERADVGQVADFATAADEAFNPAWRWARANEEAARWHSRLNLDRILKPTPFKADTVVDLGPHPDEAHHDGFSFYALRTPRALADEGGAMRHCVATYLSAVVNGRCHIVSIKRGLDRVATLELSGGGWQVQQCRGRFNAAPGGDVLTAAHHYAFDQRKAFPANPPRLRPKD